MIFPHGSLDKEFFTSASSLIFTFRHSSVCFHSTHSDTLSVVKQQDILDPLEDCFRLRMVITLLETCGQFFDRGSSKRRLDRFLFYFQRYVLSKGVIPLDVEFDLQVVLLFFI